MISDARDLTGGETLEVDICIAGAGAAGITLARALEGQGLRVLVLESGGEQGDADIRDLYAGVEVGDLAVGLTQCRVRQLGGSTNAWAGWCRRLEAEDFTVRDWLPGSGWPITVADLAPWYDLAHDTLEIGTAEFDTDAITARSGLSALPLDPARVTTVLYQYSPPTRMRTRYGDELEALEDVEVMLHASLTDIRLANDGSVSAFTLSTLDGTTATVTARAYVLALGGIENARMLLASNRQEADGVGNSSGLVGRSFMEHPHFYRNAWLVTPPGVDLTLYTGRRAATTVDEARPDGVPTEVRGALALPAAVRSREELPGLAATLRPSSSADAEARMGEVTAAQMAPVLGLDGEVKIHALDIRAEQRPIAESRVELASETDALGIPRTRITWAIDEADLRGVQDTLTLFGAELARAGIGRLWMPLDRDGLLAPTSYDRGCHHMGTTRMSASAADGVVDADLRVHDAPNLFVAGSSVYPTGGFANPTLTLVALAHRLADLLVTELTA